MIDVAYFVRYDVRLPVDGWEEWQLFVFGIVLKSRMWSLVNCFYVTHRVDDVICGVVFLCGFDSCLILQLGKYIAAVIVWLNLGPGFFV